MNTCSTCKWWQRRNCLNEQAGWNIHVTVADDHNLGYWLETSPDFGCVSHETK